MVKILQLCLCLMVIFMFSEGNTDGENWLDERDNPLKSKEDILLSSDVLKALQSILGDKASNDVPDSSNIENFKRSMFDKQEDAYPDPELSNQDLLDAVKSAIEPNADSASRHIFGAHYPGLENVKPDLLSLLHSFSTLLSDKSQDDSENSRKKSFKRSLSDKQDGDYQELTNQDLLDALKSAIEPNADSSIGQSFGSHYPTTLENVKPDLRSLLKSFSTLLSDESQDDSENSRKKRSIEEDQFFEIAHLLLVDHYKKEINILEKTLSRHNRDVNGVRSAEDSKLNEDSTNLLDEGPNVVPDSSRIKRFIGDPSETLLYDRLTLTVLEHNVDGFWRFGRDFNDIRSDEDSKANKDSTNLLDEASNVVHDSSRIKRSLSDDNTDLKRILSKLLPKVLESNPNEKLKRSPSEYLQKLGLSSEYLQKLTKLVTDSNQYPENPDMASFRKRKDSTDLGEQYEDWP